MSLVKDVSKAIIKNIWQWSRDMWERGEKVDITETYGNEIKKK